MNRIFILIAFVLTTVFSSAQSLEDYIVLGMQQHPELKALEMKEEVALEKANQVNDLPGTEFGVGYFVSEPETRTGAQKLRLSVKQMFPWFGTLNARERYARSMAAVVGRDTEIARKRLTLDISQWYYKLWVQKERLEILRESDTILQALEAVTLSRIAGGKSTAVSALQLQIQRNSVQSMIEEQEALWRSGKAGFASFLNLPADTEIMITDIPELPSADPSADQITLSAHPELLKFSDSETVIKEAEKLNRKDRLPGLGIGLDYVTVEERPMMEFSDNGKDIIMPMVSLNIPVFGDRYRSVNRQVALQLEEVASSKKVTENAFTGKMYQSLAALKAARIAYENAQKSLVLRNQAYDISLKSYAAGTTPFSEILELEELRLDLALKSVQARGDYWQQYAVLTYLSEPKSK